jgi:hypothetical protein
VMDMSGDAIDATGAKIEAWSEQWRGRIVDYFSANDINGQREVLAVVNDLERTGVHRTGGGAAPIFELRLIACAL